MNQLTRRDLGAALATSAVLLARPQGQPQAQALPANPLPANPLPANPLPANPLPANPDDELKASRAQLRDTADQLDKFPLPMSTEPATTFRP